MTDWEDALIGEPVKEEPTPIYDALHLEYREKLMERLGFKPAPTTQEKENNS